VTFPIAMRTVLESSSAPRNGVGVSVIVTLYNYAAYIERALNSVFGQTHSNLELIVVNDCSRDHSESKTRAWMEGHAHRFTSVKLLSNVANYGLSVSRNVAFEKATNDFVFVLDADNEIYPRAVERLLSACLNAKADAAYSQLEFFGDQSDIGYAYCWDPERLAHGNYIDAMALIRKDAWAAVGGYAVQDYGWEDYDLWCKFVEAKFFAVFVPQILCRYRVHRASMLRTETNLNYTEVIAQMVLKHPWLKVD
jgi:glycosyltransferase involved in cell wall biosynthesis